MADLNGLFNQMGERFDASAAAGTDAVFLYDITDEGKWSVVVRDDACTITEGEAEDPTVTLIMDAETLEGVMSGEVDGMQAFMSGSIKAEGDVMLATKLTALFPIP